MEVQNQIDKEKEKMTLERVGYSSSEDKKLNEVIERYEHIIFGKENKEQSNNKTWPGIKNMLFEKELLYKFHKRFVLVKFIETLLEKYGGSEADTIKLLKENTEDIKKIDINFGKIVEDIKIEDNEQIRVLSDINLRLRDYKIAKISFEINLESIHKDIASLKDKDISKKLLVLSEELGGIEIKYLNDELLKLSHIKVNLKEYIDNMEKNIVSNRLSDKYMLSRLKELENKGIGLKENELRFIYAAIEDIKSWNSKLPNFIGQIKELRTTIRKIKKDYEDKQLVKLLLSKTEIKKLVFFYEEYLYFKNLKYLIDKGYRENDWKDFLLIVKNIEKESKDLKNKFGDNELSENIIKFAEKYKEDIKAWGNYITAIINKKFLDETKRNEILEIGKSSVIEIFEKYKGYLKNLSSENEKKLTDLLKMRIKQLEGRKEKTLEDMKKIIREKMEKVNKGIIRIKNYISEEKTILEAYWSREKNKYLALEKELLDDYNKLQTIFDKIGIEKLDKKIKDIKEIMPDMAKWDSYFKSVLESGEKNVKSLGNVIGALYFQETNLTNIKEMAMREIEETHNEVEINWKNMQKNITGINKSIISKQRKIYNYFTDISKEQYDLSGEIGKKLIGTLNLHQSMETNKESINNERKILDYGKVA